VETDIDRYYWADLNRWTNERRCLDQPGTSISAFRQTIIDSEDAALACFFARDIASKRHLMQEVVIDANIPRYLTLFAAIVPNADIRTLQSLVIKSGNTTAIIRFARYVQSNTKRLEAAIVKANSPSAALSWLKTVPSASIKALQAILLGSDNPKHWLEVARRIKAPKTLKSIEDRLVKGKHIKECRLLAQVKGCNTKRLERVVLNSGNLKEIKALAKQNKRSEAAKLSSLF
jgi:hypothetical protein